MYKSIMKLLLIAALCLPWVTQAQGDCTPISTFPVTYGFEDSEGFTTTVTAAAACTTNVFNACWRNEQTSFNATSTTTSGRIWHIYGGTSATLIHGGAHSLILPDKGSTTALSTTMLVLPAMNFTSTNGYIVSLWIYRNGTAANPEGVKVYASDTDTIGPNAVLLGHFSRNYTLPYPNTESASGWYEYETIPTTMTGTVYIILEGQSYYGNSTYLDDITIMEAPSCPRVENLTALPSSDEVEVSWTEVGTASNWEVTVSSTTGVAFSNVVSTNPYTVSNLNPNTDYTLAVRAVCGAGDTSAVRSTSFHTACASLPTDSLPWSYGFEDASGTGATATFNPCLGRYRVGTTSAYPYTSSTQVHSGTYSGYMYSTTTIYSWLTLPLFADDISDLYLAFNVLRTSANYGHWMVGVMSDPTDITTFDTIASGQASANNVWELVEVPLASYTGTGNYLTILCPTGVTNYTYIDDITVSLPPTCPSPSSISGSNATFNSVEVSWVASGNEYIVEYGVQGFAQGTGDSLVVSTNTVTLSGLTMGLTYGVYVTAICGSDTSNPAYGTVTTLCGALTEDDLPYSEDFESYSSGANYPINACWTKGTSSTTAYPYPYSTNAVNEALSLYFYGYYPSSATSTPIYSWAALPPVDNSLDISDLMVSFYVKRGTTATSYYNTLLYVGIADSVTGFSSAAAIEGSVTWIDTIDHSSGAASSVYSEEVSFDTYTGTGKYVVFYVPVPQLAGSNTYAYNHVYLDDVVLRVIPSCFWPTEVVATTVGVDNATLSWTPDPRTPNPTAWIVEYGPHGQNGLTQGDGTIETVNDTTVTLSNLAANTEYDVYVKASCGGDESEAVLLTFTTSAYPAELPYFTDFDNAMDSSWALINANQPNHWVVSELDTVNGNAMFISSDGTTNEYTNSLSNVFAVRVFNFEDAGDYAIGFDWKANGESTYDYLRAFIIPSNVTITPGELNGISATATPSGWLNIGEYSGAVKMNLATTWQTNTYTLHIDENSTGFYRLVFFWHNDGTVSNQPPAAIDNIDVHALTCPAPVDLTVTNAAIDQIDISWSPVGDESQWQVQVNGGAWDDVNDTTYSAFNLTPETEYTFSVRAVCGDGDTSFATGPVSVMTPMDCGEDYINVRDTIGDGTSASYTYFTYNYTSYAKGYTANIFSVEEMMNMGIMTSAEIHSVSLHAGTTACTIPNLKVYAGLIDTNSFVGAADTNRFANMTLLYDSSLVTTANEWVTIEFDTTFHYDGSSNLMLLFKRTDAPTASGTFYYTSTSPVYSTLYGYASSATGTPTGTRVYYRVNMIFNMCAEVPTCMRPMEVNVVNLLDTVATIAWENVGGTYEYALGAPGFDPDNATAISTADTFVVLNNLTQNTHYDFYVRTICGPGLVSEWSVVTHILTPCAAQPLPYSEDFESYGSGSSESISPCWVKGTSSTTGYPYPYGTNVVSGLRSLYFYGYYPSSATSTPIYSYAALPMFTAPVNNLMVSFKLRRYNTTTSYYTSRMLVGVMSDPEDIGTFVGIDTIDLRDEPGGSIHQFEVPFDSYTGTGKYITFYDAVPPLYGTNTYSYSYVSLDDIVVDYIPNCRRVLDITVDSTTQNTATISWTYPTVPANGYEIEYGPQGFALGTGSTLTTVTNTITLTGLSASTSYDFYIRAYCSATETSPWSFTTNFRTSCGIYNVPFFEDFESYASGSGNPIDPCWTRGTSSTTAYPYPYTSNAINGSISLYFYGYYPSSSSSTPIYSYVALPEFSSPVDSLELSFKVRRYATTTDYYTTRLLVGVMTDPNDISTFVGVDTIDLKNELGGSIHDITVTFDSYTGTGTHIAIYDAVPPLYGTSTYSYSYAYVDDISVNKVSPCGHPFDLGASVTNNTITLEWTDTVGATSWQIEYGPTGFQLGTGTTITVNTNPYTITGLNPSTLYDIYVRSMCTSGALGGTNNGIFTVSTSQVPATVPYYYDFEAAAEWSNWQTASNNSVAWYRGTAEAAEGNYGLYVSADNGLTCNSLHATITNSAVYRDIDFGDTVSSFEVTFLAKSAGVSDGNYEGINVMLVDPSLPVAASSTSLTSPWGSFNVVHVVRDTIWHEHTLLFDNVSGVKRLVFNWYTSTTSTHPVWEGAGAIDSLVVVEQSCTRPINTTVTDVGPDYVSLTWDGPANANYVVRLRDVDDNTNTNIDNVTNTNSYVVSNLSPMTTYYVWVYHVCDSNNISYSAPRITFTTTCTLISAVDTLWEDFDSITGTAYNTAGVLPDCWEGYSNGTSDLYWPHVTDGSTYSYSVTGNAITMTSGSTATYGNTKIVRLPKFVEPISTMTMSYWYCTESSSIGKLYVGYMTGFDYENDFVPLVEHPASQASYHSGNGPQTAGHGVFDTISFDTVPSNALFIAFKWYQDGTFYSVCIDNVQVTSTGNYCPTPVALPASDVTFSSATVNWSSSASDFEVAVKAATDAVWPTETAVSAHSYAITGLAPSTIYQYRVRAICDAAEGMISDWTVGTFTTDSLPCVAPTNMWNTVADLTTATFDWTVNGEESAWRIYVWNSTFSQSYDVTTHPATVTGLSQTTDYYATVVAVCGGILESETSDTVAFTTATCQPVTNVAVSNIAQTSATVSWTGSAATYTIEYGQGDFEQGNGTTVNNITTTTYNITGLTSDRNYSVYVRANCDANSPSAWSERVQFRTLVQNSIADVNGVNVTIYPNPTTDNTTIALSGVSGEVTITIVDLSGRTVKTDSMSCDGDCVKTVEVSGLAEGAYFVRVNGEGVNMVKKLVVK